MNNLSFNIPRTLLAMALGALTGWAFYLTGNPGGDVMLLAYVSGVMSALMIAGLVGLRNTRRQIASIRALSSVMLFVVLIVDGIFGQFAYNVSFFIIFNVALLIIWLLIASAVANASDMRNKPTQV